MINITIDKNNLTLEMKGHAGMTGDKGYDLVCCAASMVGQMFLYSCTKRQNDAETEFKIDDGYLKVHVKPVPYRIVSFKRLMDYIIDGFELLQGNYPAAVKLNIKEQEDDEEWP